VPAAKARVITDLQAGGRSAAMVWAFCCNILAIPLAALGFLNPWSPRPP
jgi:cation transport ATPase